MHDVKCNICDGDSTEAVTERNNYRIVRCRKCGLEYVNPRPSPEAILQLFDSYHQRYEMDAGEWADLLHHCFAKVSGLLCRMFPGRGRILDTGLGHLDFTALMKERKWSVCKLSPSVWNITCALREGSNVVEPTMDLSETEKSSFDAITAFFVLEHLSDPLATLKRMCLLLKSGGVVIVVTPLTTPAIRFISSVGVQNNLYAPPFHLYIFSPRTINLLLKMAGFTSVRILRSNLAEIAEHPENRAMAAIHSILGPLKAISRGQLDLSEISRIIIAVKPSKEHRINLLIKRLLRMLPAAQDPQKEA